MAIDMISSAPTRSPAGPAAVAADRATAAAAVTLAVVCVAAAARAAVAVAVDVVAAAAAAAAAVRAVAAAAVAVAAAPPLPLLRALGRRAALYITGRWSAKARRILSWHGVIVRRRTIRAHLGAL